MQLKFEDDLKMTKMYSGEGEVGFYKVRAFSPFAFFKMMIFFLITIRKRRRRRKW